MSLFNKNISNFRKKGQKKRRKDSKCRKHFPALKHLKIIRGNFLLLLYNSSSSSFISVLLILDKMTNHEIQCYYHGKAMKSFMCYHDLYKPVYGRINELINFRVVWSYLNPCQISSCRYNQEKTTFTHTICPESVSLSQAPCNYLLANFLL